MWQSILVAWVGAIVLSICWLIVCAIDGDSGSKGACAGIAILFLGALVYTILLLTHVVLPMN